MKSILLTLLSIYTAFLAGFGMYYMYNKYFNSRVVPCPTKCDNTVVTTNPGKTLDLVDFDILLVSASSPQQLFHINHINNKAENYKVTYLNYSLDGAEFTSQEIPYESITWDQVTKNRDNSEYSIRGSFTTKGKTINFEIPSVKLGMVIRAQPMEGKYGGSTPQPTANITINNTKSPAYAAVTAAFFSEYIPVSVKKLQVQTDWLMYFDKDWNFYHLDKTQVANPTPSYYSHSFLGKFYSVGSKVEYFNNIGVSFVSNNVTELEYANDLGNYNKTFVIKDSITPYPYATTYLISDDSLNGVGVYTKLDGR